MYGKIKVNLTLACTKRHSTAILTMTLYFTAQVVIQIAVFKKLLYNTHFLCKDNALICESMWLLAIISLIGNR